MKSIRIPLFLALFTLILLAWPSSPAIGEAAASHTSSSFKEASNGMAVTMVPIGSGEIPAVPGWSAQNTPGALTTPLTTDFDIPFTSADLHDPDPGLIALPDPSNSECTRWASATGYFYGWDSNGVERPLSFATVWLWDLDRFDDPNLGPILGLASIGAYLLDYDGYLDTGPFCNQDGPNAGTKDLLVEVVPASTAAKVVRYKVVDLLNPWNFQSTVYSAWHPFQRDNIADGNRWLGRRIVPMDTRVSDAFTVYSLWSGVLAGWDLIANRVGLSFSDIPQVEVHHLGPLLGDDPAPGAEPFPHYMVAGSGCGWTGPFDPFGPDSSDCAAHWDDLEWQIHIDTAISARNPFVVNHLYGHYVMQRYHNGWYPSNDGSPATSSRYAGDFDEFTICDNTGTSYQLYCYRRISYDYWKFDLTWHVKITWAEAFADAFALAAMESRPGGGATSVFNFQHNPTGTMAGQTWSVDFEVPSTLGLVYREKTVAAALHDVMDQGIDGSDDYAGTFSRIWEAFTQGQHLNLQEFWNAWFSVFHDEHLNTLIDTPILGAQRSLSQNGFLPSETSLSTGGPPTPSSISLAWTKADDTDFSRYEVHKSTSAGFTPSSSTLVTTIYSQSQKSYTVEGLVCSRAYYFEVVVYETDGWKRASNKIQADTATCNPGGGGSPFVAPWNGTEYVLDNNILPESEDFTRAVQNVDDFYRLHEALVPKDGLYSLQIVEFEDEHTRLDHVRLLAVDHENDFGIVVNHTGDIRSFEYPEPPETAVDNYGRDVLGLVSVEDGAFYEAWRGDSVDLGFGRVFLPWTRLLVKVDPGHGSKFSVDAFVLVEGSLEYVDTVHSRIHFAWEYIDLSPYVPSDDLVVRLSTTKNHRIDIVGIDTSPQHSVQVQDASLVEASHSEFGDVLSLLSAEDGQYVNITPGQQVTIEFSIPDSRDEARSFVLASYGYYTHKYQPYVGEDLTIDGLTVEAAAVLSVVGPFFTWEVDVERLVWDMGDGTRWDGFVVRHSYLEAGEFTISVAVYYANGHIGIVERRILVSM